MKVTPAKTIRHLKERIRVLEQNCEHYRTLLQRANRSLEIVKADYDGFSRAVHQLAPYIYKPEEAK